MLRQKNAGHCTWSLRCWVALLLIPFIALTVVELCCRLKFANVLRWRICCVDECAALTIYADHSMPKFIQNMVYFHHVNVFGMSFLVFFSSMFDIHCLSIDYVGTLSILFICYSSVSAKQLTPVPVGSWFLLQGLQCTSSLVIWQNISQFWIRRWRSWAWRLFLTLTRSHHCVLSLYLRWLCYYLSCHHFAAL